VTVVERFVARIKAERKAAGRSPTIESAAVYRLLDAVVDAAGKNQGPDKTN
jgi:hypothetical protein